MINGWQLDHGREVVKIRIKRSWFGRYALVAEAWPRLANAARLVVNTAGPYRRHGLALVEACATAGTHYADLAGELLFMRESIDRYDAVAAGTAARIVHCCGVDSVPSDLGVLLLHQRAAAEGAGGLGTPRCL